jgi:hypothetical protein
MLGHPGAHPHQGPQVDDRRKHHSLRRELLDVMQHGFPFVMVTLPGLVLVQRIDVGIALILDNTTARRYGLSRPYDIRSSFISIPIGKEEVKASLPQLNQRN